MSWYLAKPKHEFKHEVIESYGTFESSLEAKRAYIVDLDPLCEHMSDDWIKETFGTLARLGYIKAIKTM